MKNLTVSLDDANNLGKCDSVENKLYAIYDYIAEDMRIKSKCEWYKHSKISKKILKILEKQRGIQNIIKNLFWTKRWKGIMVPKRESTYVLLSLYKLSLDLKTRLRRTVE